jgi:uncharacterized protein (TIGR00369 family)
MSTSESAATGGFHRPAPGEGVGGYVRVGLHEIEGGPGDMPRVVGHAPAAAHLRGPDGRGVRAGMLLTMLDMVGGLCGGLAALPDGWVVSTNLSARTVRTEHTGPFRLDAWVLRAGRASVVTAVTIRDEGAADALVVDGVLTSAVLVPQNGPPQWTRPMVIDAGPPPATPLPRVTEWLGPLPVSDAAVEMPLVESLRNPWGILHGGAVAALVDLASEHVAGGVTTDMVLHFLAPNRVGPVRATAVPVGSGGARADGTVLRVEVRDQGADRVTALAIATSQPHG